MQSANNTAPPTLTRAPSARVIPQTVGVPRDFVARNAALTSFAAAFGFSM